MRILFLNTYKDWGGGEKWIINIGKGLQAKGHHIIISGHPGSESERRTLANKLEFIPFREGPDIAFWKIPLLRKLLRKNQIEVAVFVQTRDVKLGALAARLEGTKLVFARHALACLKKDRLYHKFIYSRFIDGMLLNSLALKDLFLSYGWFAEDIVHVIYDGVTIPDKLPDIDLHQEFNLKRESKVIIGTGRLVDQKRFDLLIKVAKLAKDSNKNWSIIIIGKGQLQNELSQMTKELEVEDYIKFIGFRKDVLPIMKAGDLFALSSDSEGMSNALIEAMGVGKACVATDVFGVSELFQEGSSGMMVERGDPAAIYKAIDTILSDPDLRQKLETNGMELIRKKFSIEMMVNSVEQLFMDQLEKRTALSK